MNSELIGSIQLVVFILVGAYYILSAIVDSKKAIIIIASVIFGTLLLAEVSYEVIGAMVICVFITYIALTIIVCIMSISDDKQSSEIQKIIKTAPDPPKYIISQIRNYLMESNSYYLSKFERSQKAQILIKRSSIRDDEEFEKSTNQMLVDFYKEMYAAASFYSAYRWASNSKRSTYFINGNDDYYKKIACYESIFRSLPKDKRKIWRRFGKGRGRS